MRPARPTRRSLLAAATLLGCVGRETPPNILWITSEDNGPFLGCYGDLNATTPNLDALAAEGTLYENAFATYPVCAPSRCTLITGVPANSLGTGHMRSVNPLPAGIRMFPSLLRDAGYYCTNNSKEDYNTPTPDGVWDESSREATYRNRAPGQPFFHVRNLTTTHESSLFEQHEPRHSPSRVVLPPYHPDTPTFRSDWAQYYDHVTSMDSQAGEILDQLEADGLTQDTIVFYFSDHGGILPRTKRFVYDSGARVPLIIRYPERFRNLSLVAPGDRTNRLVGFEDFAPTVLELAGVPIPSYMTGVPFAGSNPGPRRDFVHIVRDRMGPCPNLIRSVRDERFQYIRNYLPHIPPSQYNTYQAGIPSWVEIFKLLDEGSLGKAQKRMFEPPPREELYDTITDPHEVNNLAGQPEFDDVLALLRSEEDRRRRAIRDTGFIPEIEMQRLTADSTPYEFAHDPERYPLDRILKVVELASEADTTNLPVLGMRLADENTVVRYWAAVGCRLLEENAAPARDALLQASADQNPSDAARMMAAEALCYIGETEKALEVLTGYLNHGLPWVRFTAAVHLGLLGKRARPARQALESFVESEEERYPRDAGIEALRQLE